MLLSLGCLWTDVLSTKLLLGAGGKGDVEKGGEEDPSTALSSAVALGGWEKEGFFSWGKILGRPLSLRCCLCSLWGGSREGETHV